MKKIKIEGWIAREKSGMAHFYKRKPTYSKKFSCFLGQQEFGSVGEIYLSQLFMPEERPSIKRVEITIREVK